MIVQRSIRITLPLPDRILSPNARAHWATKSRAVKAARATARYEATVAGGACLMLTTARIDIRAFHTIARRRDRDNLISSCKAYFDGLADAGLIANDSGFTLGPVVFGVDKANPRLELEVSWQTQEADSPGRSAKANPSPSRSMARKSARSS
jgi:Holliday junction resolvase RusA-like endonuclease